jgi:hypothetical protein
MLFNSFWKRLFILNIVILLVLFRIFGVIEKYIKKHSYNTNSLFPILTDDGYPFFNSINCDIKQLTSITKNIIDEDNITITNDFNFPNDILKSKECFFMDKYTLCKGNKECLNKINKKEQEIYTNEILLEKKYHSKINNNRINDIIGISSLINIMNNKNEFIDDKNNNIEILFYNKIISGYYSFLFIKQYDNNIKNNLYIDENDYRNYNILKQVTQYENRMNDLFYLFSLMLYSSNKYKNNNMNNTETDNTYFYLNFANECIELNDETFELSKNKIIPKNKKIFEEIFINQMNNLFECINDIYEKNSFNIDFTAINSMIKILSDEKSITNYEINSIIFFLKELSKMINNIFTAEIKLNNSINVLRQNYVYILIIYGCSSLAIIFFINKYFLKNKNKYENDKKRKEKIIQQKYANFGNNKIKDKKITKEEYEYVQKLAKENKAEFVITK